MLPSDRVVRVACEDRDARVQSILDALETRDELRALTSYQHAASAPHHETLQTKSSARPYAHAEARVFPLDRTVRKQDDDAVKPSTRTVFTLLLVRTDRALARGARVCDELRDMDILELQLPQPRAARSVDSAYTAHSNRLGHHLRLDPQSASSLALESPLSSSKQRPTRISHRLLPPGSRSRIQTLKVAAASHTVQSEVFRCPCFRFVTQQSAEPQRGHAPRSEPNHLLSSARSTARVATVLLRGSMQVLDQLAALETQISTLLLCVRDASSTSRGCAGATVKVDELLPPLLRVAHTLWQHTAQRPMLQLTQSGKFPIKDFTRDLGHALKDASSECVLRVPVCCQGWVKRAEWGAFWRNERREFASLCDDGILRFFSSEHQCSEFLFALARTRSGVDTGCGGGGGGGGVVLLEKKHAPQSWIDLSDGARGWNVRKGDAEASERYAFALFEHQTKLRVIVDVESCAEVDTWLTAISSELQQTETFVRLKQAVSAGVLAGADGPSCEEKSELERATDSLQNGTSSIVAAPKRQRHQRSFKPPLQWLHAQMERLHGHSARHQRLQSSSLSQARKDLQRDRIQINGLEYPGRCVDHVVLGLTTSILRALRPRLRLPIVLEQGRAIPSRDNQRTAESLEMAAMRLARELFVCSARTVGGGDILDALHLVFPSASFSVCPTRSEAEPISVRLSSGRDLQRSEQATTADSDHPPPVAEITVRMCYCVVPSSAMAQPCESRSLDTSASESETKPLDTTSSQQVVKVVGTYYRKLVSDLSKWHEIDGHVHLEFLH